MICVLIAGAFLAFASPAGAQGAAGPSTLRVVVQDATELGLPHAQVVLVDESGAERTAAVDAQGVAVMTGLQPGAYVLKVSAEGFRSVEMPVTVRRGNNTAEARLAVAISEELVVAEEAADQRRDNGFTQTLTADEIRAPDTSTP